MITFCNQNLELIMFYKHIHISTSCLLQEYDNVVTMLLKFDKFWATLRIFSL